MVNGPSKGNPFTPIRWGIEDYANALLEDEERLTANYRRALGSTDHVRFTSETRGYRRRLTVSLPVTLLGCGWWRKRIHRLQLRFVDL